MAFEGLYGVGGVLVEAADAAHGSPILHASIALIRDRVSKPLFHSLMLLPERSALIGVDLAHWSHWGMVFV